MQSKQSLAYLLLLVQLCNPAQCKTSGTFYIQSLANCDYLTADDKCPMSRVVTCPLTKRKGQKWIFKSIGKGCLIINCLSGLALDVEGGGNSLPPNLHMWPVTNGACNQRWSFEGNGVIRSLVPKKCWALDVCDPKKGKKSLVGVHQKHGKINQKFKTIPV